MKYIIFFLFILLLSCSGNVKKCNCGKVIEQGWDSKDSTHYVRIRPNCKEDTVMRFNMSRENWSRYQKYLSRQHMGRGINYGVETIYCY
jgi:hypothetical protein